MTKAAVDPEKKVIVPLLDLKIQYQSIREEIREAVDRVFDRQQFILGPEVAAFEREVAEYCQVNHAVGCASGSDAIMLALMALGIGPGDEVIIPTFTFFATGGYVAHVGARPVFVDIDPVDFNIDCEQVEAKVTSRTKAIMPVHLYGQCANMDALLDISKRTGVPIIEDAAQSIGATFRDRQAGSMGRIGCFSFFPTKNLGAAGDGGMVVTNDSEIDQRLRALRVHGSRVKYHYEMLGVNSRLDEVQAAVLRVKLKYLDEWSAARANNADRYDTLFRSAGLDDDDNVIPPVRQKGARHIFNQYVIRARERDALMAYLKEHSIGTEVYYPVPLHQQPCFAAFGSGDDSLPNAEQASKEVLALPIYPELTEDQQRAVVDRIAKFYLE
ncbi:MAG TPA: DegT/DnrJ/EryC1/StrS family aminotransferase [Blastocatellia bacterium]|nr:DegT/DnrJ/EryC1/StrS family aminotransferase [Blastocatellia bacterium]